jgi:hypothetical protein
MTPQGKLRTANLLMLAGLVPLLLGIGWIVSIIAYARQHRGEMGGSDAFLMIGILFVTYAFALIVSGGSALWSVIIAKRHPGVQGRTGAVIKALVCVALALPVLWYLRMTFFR